jgi:hypothetical protein
MTSAEAYEAIEIPSATDDPEAYVQALLDVAGDRDPFESMATTPSRARELCADLPLGLAKVEPEPGEWPAEYIVGHLYDVDVVYGFRWRLVLTEENPSYPGYDEKLWAPLPRLPFPQLLTAWEGLRASNVALLRAISEQDWQRTGRHGEQGGETLEVMVRKVVGHDIAHLDQLARAVRDVRDRGGQAGS